MTTALSGGGITSKIDVTYLNFFLKEFNAVSQVTCLDCCRRGMMMTALFLYL